MFLDEASMHSRSDNSLSGYGSLSVFSNMQVNSTNVLFFAVLWTPWCPLLTWLLVLHFEPKLSLNLCSVSSVLSLVNNLLSFLFLHVLLLSLSPLLFALSVSPVIATPVRSFLPLHAPSLPLLSSPPGSEVWLPLLPLSSPASPSLCQLQHRWVSAACVHVCLWRSSI